MKKKKPESVEEVRREMESAVGKFLKDPKALERLKAASPGLSEEFLKQMLEKAKDNTAARLFASIQNAPEPEAPENIWDIEDPANLQAALAAVLDERCGCGEHVEALTPQERVFYVGWLLDMEVNNGGFSQYFFNSAGAFADEVADAFQAIGAPKTAAICRRAIDAFGCPIPKDREARYEMMTGELNEEAEEVLEACDEAYYAYEEDLTALWSAYIQANRAAFRA